MVLFENTSVATELVKTSPLASLVFPLRSSFFPEGVQQAAGGGRGRQEHETVTEMLERIKMQLF